MYQSAKITVENAFAYVLFLMSVNFCGLNVQMGDCLDLSLPYSSHYLLRDRLNRVKWMIHGSNPEVSRLGKDAILVCSVPVLLIQLSDRAYIRVCNQNLDQMGIVLLWIVSCTDERDDSKPYMFSCNEIVAWRPLY